jgi:hypothetical protein
MLVLRRGSLFLAGLDGDLAAAPGTTVGRITLEPGEDVFLLLACLDGEGLAVFAREGDMRLRLTAIHGFLLGSDAARQILESGTGNRRGCEDRRCHGEGYV